MQDLIMLMGFCVIFLTIPFLQKHLITADMLGEVLSLRGQQDSGNSLLSVFFVCLFLIDKGKQGLSTEQKGKF